MTAIVLSHCTVVDGVSDEPRRNTNILIRDDRIAAVGTSVDVPADARRIDLRGGYVMAGLLNMHTHLSLSLPGAAGDAVGA